MVYNDLIISIESILMSNVVLLAINAKYVHSSLSVWVIAEGVAQFAELQHDVRVVEATINQKLSDIVELVAVHKPDVIGVSSYIWNAGMLPELLNLLRKQLPDVVIVLGGPEATNNADYWLENGANYVLQGEGEYVFPTFLDAIGTRGTVLLTQNDEVSPKCAGRTVPVVPGTVPVAPPTPPVNPYTDAYLNSLNGRLAYIETSRGCPFRCSFCLSAGSGVRYFPLDSVKNQILKLSKSGTKTLKFVDRTFNCNAERAYELFEYVIGLDTTCTFHFEVAADLFNEHMLSLLRSAQPGRIQFEIGLQSFFEPALNAVSRKTDVEKAERNIKALMQMQNIHIHIDLIAGLPYETLSDFINSFDRAYALNAHHLQLGFLKMLHGSVLREQADTYGIQFTPNPPYEIISNNWLSADDIQTLKQAENALHHTFNKGRFLSTLHYAKIATGMRPFTLMHSLGVNYPNHGTQLENYAVQIFEHFTRLPGIDKEALQDCMIYDWLGMVKGKNAPAFLKNDDDRRKIVAEVAEKTLGRKMKREEYAVLTSGVGVFVDSNDRDPVTGLYRVYLCR